MKRFHTECSADAHHEWQRGGSKIAVSLVNGQAWNITPDKASTHVPCAIIGIGDRGDHNDHKCIIEVADEYEARLLAAGLKPVEVAKPQIVRMQVWREFKTNHVLPHPAVWESGVVKPMKYIGDGVTIGKVIAVYGEVYDFHNYKLVHGDVEVLPEHLELARKHEVKPVAEVPESDEAFVTAEKWLAAVKQQTPVQTATVTASHTTTSNVAIGTASHATADVVHITPQATIAITHEKAMTQPMTQPTTTQQPTRQSWIQRERDSAKNLSSDARTAQLVSAVISTLLFAAATAGIVDAAMKNAMPWIVFLGLAAPMLVTSATYFWIVVYAIATCDYVPPTPAQKPTPKPLPFNVNQPGDVFIHAPTSKPAPTPQGSVQAYRDQYLAPTPKPARTVRGVIGRIIWWAVSSACYSALGYAACWLQQNWTTVCFDLGAFLQRVSQ